MGYERIISYDEDSISFENNRAKKIKERIKALLETNDIKKDKYKFEAKGRQLLKQIKKQN